MRYAIYYTPDPSSLLWKLGCRWLGRDSLTQKNIKQDHFPGVNPDRLYELTRIPRRYGLHATLKAPFRLKSKYNKDNLIHALKKFATGLRPFSTPPMVLRRINGFYCLCPENRSTQIDALAANCVTTFDKYRAPLTRLELARRHAAILTESERQNLSDYGYPYVMEQFRFHITLTSRIADASEKKLTHAALSDIFAKIIGKTTLMDSISLCIEPSQGEPFYCVERFKFTENKQDARGQYTDNLRIQDRKKKAPQFEYTSQ